MPREGGEGKRRGPTTCIAVLRGTCPPLVERLGRHAPSEIALCAIVKAELLFGARRSARVSENLALVERFAAPFACFSFDDPAAERYGLLRAELTRSGGLIGPNDLLIASIALACDATLVTRNLGEFRRVVGLRVEDWESPT